MKTIKRIFAILFETSIFGIINPFIWVVFGCVTPFIGMLFNSDAYSKPVNPAALVLWGLAIVSLIYNVVIMVKEKSSKTKK